MKHQSTWALLLLTACGSLQQWADSSSGQGNAAQGAGSPAATVCPTGTGTRFSITDGVEEDPAHYPPIVLVATTSGFCSGTFVAPNAVLTAAHCLNDSQVNGAPLAEQTWIVQQTAGAPNGFVPTAAYYPLWAGEGNQKDTGDLAVLKLSGPVAPSVIPIGPSPSPGTPFTLAGYGVLSEDQQATSNPCQNLYSGTNQVAALTGDVIFSFGDSGDLSVPAGTPLALGAPGDSGGPMLVGGAVVGVESYGSGRLHSRDVTGQANPISTLSGSPLPVSSSVFAALKAQVLSGRPTATDFHTNLNTTGNLSWLRSLAAKGIAIQFQ